MSIYPRPRVVSVLSAFHGVLGPTLVLIGIFAGVEAAEYIMIPNVRPDVLQAALIAHGALALLLAVGMWRGYSWAWYFAQLSFIASVVRNVAGFMLIEDVVDEFGAPAGGIRLYYAAYVARAVVSLICLQLFLTRPVVDFFDVPDRTARTYSIVAFVAAVGAAVVVYFLRQSFV